MHFLIKKLSDILILKKFGTELTKSLLTSLKLNSWLSLTDLNLLFSSLLELNILGS